MTLASRVLAGAATMAIVVGSATAANAQMFTPGNPTVPDWQGLYVGAFGGVASNIGVGTGALSTGAHFGFNIVRDRFVGGFEVAPGAIFNGTGAIPMVFANARAGVLAGQRTLIYGEGGFGLFFAGGALPVFTLGAGAEFGLNNHLSASFEVKALSGLDPGPPVFDSFMFQWGLNWHP